MPRFDEEQTFDRQAWSFVGWIALYMLAIWAGLGVAEAAAPHFHPFYAPLLIGFFWNLAILSLALIFRAVKSDEENGLNYCEFQEEITNNNFSRFKLVFYNLLHLTFLIFIFSYLLPKALESATIDQNYFWAYLLGLWTSKLTFDILQIAVERVTGLRRKVSQ